MPGCATRTQVAMVTGKIYVSLEYTCEKYGFDWQYDPTTGVATISKDKTQIKLRKDSRLILVNGLPEYLDIEIVMNNGVLLVPSGFVDKYMAAPLSSLPAREKTFQIKFIVIDPGHGGNDPGALGKDGLKEKNLTLDIATRVKDILDGNGVKVILTRQDDTFLPLPERSDVANTQNADLFVSIHSNSSRVKRVSGFEVFYLSQNADISLDELTQEENQALGALDQASDVNSNSVNETLRDMMSDENRSESMELARDICKSSVELLSVVNRGIKGANFQILRNAKMPAVLVEVGFISNKREGSRLRDDYYKQMVAEAIAAGILAYKDKYEKTNGFTN